jgi:hypothetical protein
MAHAGYGSNDTGEYDDPDVFTGYVAKRGHMARNWKRRRQLETMPNGARGLPAWWFVGAPGRDYQEASHLSCSVGVTQVTQKGSLKADQGAMPRVRKEPERFTAPDFTEKSVQKRSGNGKGEAKVGSNNRAAKRSKSSKSGSRDKRGVQLTEPYFDISCVGEPLVAQLQSRWELVALGQLLWILKSGLRLGDCSLKQLELALAEPQGSFKLDEILTKLLLKKKDRQHLQAGQGFPSSWWSVQLKEVVRNWYDEFHALHLRASIEEDEVDDGEGDKGDQEASEEQGEKDKEQGAESDGGGEPESIEAEVELEELTEEEERRMVVLESRLMSIGSLDVSPLEEGTFAELPLLMRLHMILGLAEWRVEGGEHLEALRQLEEDDIRCDAVGVDAKGNQYFYFPQFFDDARLYRREKARAHHFRQADQVNDASNDASNSAAPQKQTQKQQQPQREPRFELWVNGTDSFRSFLEDCAGSSSACERDMHVGLEDVMRLLETRRKGEEKREMWKQVERKRSGRLQVTPITTHHPPLTTHHSPLTTHHFPLTTHHFPLITHSSPTHHPLITHSSPTHHPLITHSPPSHHPLTTLSKGAARAAG